MLAWGGDEGEWVVGGFDGVEVVELEAVCGGDVVVDGVVFEDQDAVEEVGPGGDVAPGV